MADRSIFDIVIDELSKNDSGTEQLDKCMQFDYSLSRKVPLRYRIIALGFIRKYSLQELNEKLDIYGCARLYARSLWEASLMYAFSNGLDYDTWRLVEEKTRKGIPELLKPVLSSDSKVTMKSLHGYLEMNSVCEGEDLITRHKTMHLESELVGSIKDYEQYIAFINDNIESFTTAREKTRYYFCKYLYEYLNRKIEEYLRLSDLGIRLRKEYLLDELEAFHGAADLKKKSLPKSQVRELLENTPISSAVIFADFNDFFFNYVNMDWMHTLIEAEGSIEYFIKRWNEDTDPKSEFRIRAGRLIEAARHADKKLSRMDDKDVLRALSRQLEEEEKELDKIYSTGTAGRGYQLNRTGENTVRKYIKGALDIDRVSFICYLLFFGSDIKKKCRLYIDLQRLNDILDESGFRKLDLKDNFDYFVIHYLEADDPVDYLMEEVTSYAMKEENFYLYKLYKESRSAESDFGKLIQS